MNLNLVNLSNLSLKLNDFRIEERYFDVIIQCDNKHFKCHRIILALASSFFDTMFSGNFKGRTKEIISLPDLRDLRGCPSVYIYG